MGAFNLLDQMTFYGAYHNNKYNQLVHLFFVPTILFSAMVAFCATGPLAPLPEFIRELLPVFIAKNFVINGAFFLFLIYAGYYLSLDFTAAISYDILLFLMYIGSVSFYYTFGDRALLYAGLIHAFSWWAQVHLGHMIIEGRKPALFDSFFQSLVLAPLFVWFELLFMFGWRKELKDDLNRRILIKIKELDAANKTQ